MAEAFTPNPDKKSDPSPVPGVEQPFVPPEQANSSDPSTDKAVDAIQRSDSDAELEAAFPASLSVEKPSLWQNYLAHKKWTIPVTILVLLLVLLSALPFTRYAVAGLFIRHAYTVHVVDAQTRAAVTNAQVSFGQTEVETDAKGVAVLKQVRPGKTTVRVSKQYYQSFATSVTVGLKAPKSQSVQLQATGRQVTVGITNGITGDAIAGAMITVSGTAAKTDSKGNAHLVLPANDTALPAKIQAAGYNDKPVTLHSIQTADDHNAFKLVPAGKVYFLSNKSGKVDVVSTDYDGGNRRTLLAGTGYENVSATRMIVSPNQKYVALLASRTNAANSAGVYIINTESGKMSTADEAAGLFGQAIGWDNDVFVYQIQTGDQYWQSGRQTLRAFNAATQSAIKLDSSLAEGDQNDYAYQSLSNATIIDGVIVYTKMWHGTSQTSHLQSKMGAVSIINPDGSGKKTLRDIDVSNTSWIEPILAPAGPHVAYIGIPNGNGGLSDGAAYYKYTKGNLTQTNTISYADFTSPNLNNGYVSLSSSGSMALYQDSVDGHLVVSTADADGNNKHKVATLPEDGLVQDWLTDKYILVSQSANRLYIVPTAGSNKAVPAYVADFLGDGRP